jgi:uncharacterized membrane protein YgaE (UPF0421/DUF939 family)
VNDSSKSGLDGSKEKKNGRNRSDPLIRDGQLMTENSRQAETKTLIHWRRWPILVHSLRTAVAAVTSVLAARLFRLPEAYWAAITTLVIVQSSLGAALKVSSQRFFGTALGALAGGIVATYFRTDMFVFGTTVFFLGLLCALPQLDRSAYRFGGVTLAIVMLVPKTDPPWLFAVHRFAEVFIGIAVALLLTWIWPESEVTSS